MKSKPQSRIPLAATTPIDRWRLAARVAAVWLAAVALIVVVKSAAHADGPVDVASALSDGAFSLLDSINGSPAGPGALLGPVANLASDAQTLSAALGRSDNGTAGRAMAAVQKDRRNIEALLRSGNHLPDPAQWKSIENQIATLSRTVHPMAGAVPTGVPSASTPATAAELPPAAPPAPQVIIESRVFSDGGVRVHGYLQGTNLKSAGIFNDDQLVKNLDFERVAGRERVRFDLSIQSPTASETIRVTDQLDRIASAMVAPEAGAIPNTPTSGEKVIELGGGVGYSSVASAGSGVGPPAVGSHNTDEIPRAVPRGGSSRKIPGGVGTGLVGVSINVIFADQSMDEPGMYHVVGQISGAGVRRAGVYVEGRLVKQIPVSPGGYSAFDVKFPMIAGKEASIRAYGAGSNYVESSIDTSDNGMTDGGMTVMRGPGMYPPNPYAYGYPYRSPANPYGAPPPYGGYGYPPPYGYRRAPVPWYRRLIP